jgi:hypothetical protein
MPSAMKLWNYLGSTRVPVQSAPTLMKAKPGKHRDRVVVLSQSPEGRAARRRRDDTLRDHTPNLGCSPMLDPAAPRIGILAGSTFQFSTSSRGNRAATLPFALTKTK